MSAQSDLVLVLLVLAAAVVLVPLFKRLGLGAVLGYLTAGALLGPSALGVVQDTHGILELAELGVVMLLFIIGLELKPSRLWSMRRTVFGLGAAQVIVTSALFIVIFKLLGFSNTGAAIAGFGLSLSSTPFALQLLAERNELTSVHGRSAFGILLFQDLAVLPMLAVLPLLGDSATAHQTTFSSGSLTAMAVILGIIAVGRILLRPLFRIVASTGQREVFAAAALFVVFGTAIAMQFAGLSMALGTFLAGMLLSDSEYRHAIEADIEPFKGLLMGLFFMAIGMQMDFALLFTHPGTIFGVVFGLMAIKYVALTVLARGFGMNGGSAAALAAILPQGGEFAFVLFGTATAQAILPKQAGDSLSLAVALSLAITPLLVALQDRIRCRNAASQKRPYDSPTSSGSTVIVAGFGRVGQIVSRLLRIKGIAFTALDHSAEQVDVVRRFGSEAFYGDASREDLLEAAGAKDAKVFVLAIDDVEASMRTARTVRESFPHLVVFARARNRQHVFELMDLGITHIFRETLGSSLELSNDLLVHLGTEPEKARSVVERFRRHDALMLKEQKRFQKDEGAMIGFTKQAAQQLIAAIQADEE